MSISKDFLNTTIRHSWQHETSSTPDEWDAQTAPERGQCVPTALVVQDYFGGEIERLATVVDGNNETHYRNLVDGEIVDFTRAQYPETQELAPAPKELTPEYATLRDYLLSNESTASRYRILAQKVAKLLEIDN